jgi:hypothetical protein
MFAGGFVGFQYVGGGVRAEPHAKDAKEEGAMGFAGAADSQLSR